MMTKRLEWIDNIKGIGILCVVLGHIAYMPFNKTEWMLGHLFPMFYMSMFFMASGYVGYKIFTRPLAWRDVANYKNFTLLIPFLVLGLSYTALLKYQQGILYDIESLGTLFTVQAKNGYWFIYSLFFFRLTSIVVLYIAQSMRINNFYLQCLGILLVGW
ncbi:acyltransferase family protein [Bacteroides sp. AN502(2024)]|uniref:acyltransferase family protein n=1 Tax=Bacteroides sp. AN502(2024) TaxID=3160599 RepID=UPI0035118B44